MDLQKWTLQLSLAAGYLLGINTCRRDKEARNLPCQCNKDSFNPTGSSETHMAYQLHHDGWAFVSPPQLSLVLSSTRNTCTRMRHHCSRVTWKGLVVGGCLLAARVKQSSLKFIALHIHPVIEFKFEETLFLFLFSHFPLLK